MLVKEEVSAEALTRKARIYTLQCLGRADIGGRLAMRVRDSVLGKLSRARGKANRNIDAFLFEKRAEIQNSAYVALESKGEETTYLAASKAAKSLAEMEEAAKSGELPGNDRSLFLFAAKTGFSRPQLRQLGDALALLLPLDEKIIADQTGYANAVMYSSCEMPVGYGACEIPVGYAIGKNAKIRKAEGSAKLGSVISTQKNANGLTALSLDFRIDFSGKLLRMPEFGEPAPLLRMFSDANLDFWVFYGWLAADLAEKYGIGRETLDAAFTSRNSYSFSIKTVPGQKFGLELEAKAGLHLTPVLKIGLTMKNPGGSLAMDGPPKMSFPALERTFSLESGCCGNMPPFDMSLN